MKFTKSKVQVKDGVVIGDTNYSGYTGTTCYVGNNNVWLVQFDEETISKRIPIDEMYESLLRGSDVSLCYFNEDDLIFI